VKCVRPAASNASCAMTSAMGERQILPVQTKQICKGCEAWEDDEVKASDIWLCLPALLPSKQLEVAYRVGDYELTYFQYDERGTYCACPFNRLPAILGRKMGCSGPNLWRPCSEGKQSRLRSRLHTSGCRTRRENR